MMYEACTPTEVCGDDPSLREGTQPAEGASSGALPLWGFLLNIGGRRRHFNRSPCPAFLMIVSLMRGRTPPPADIMDLMAL